MKLLKNLTHVFVS